MLKWSIELTQFEIVYKPRVAIKGKTLADFIAEFTLSTPKLETFVDGSSNENYIGAGLTLLSPEQHRISCTLRFTFKASNNEAEYEALLAGLRLAVELKVETITIYSDSQLVVNQVNTSRIGRICD